MYCARKQFVVNRDAIPFNWNVSSILSVMANDQIIVIVLKEGIKSGLYGHNKLHARRITTDVAPSVVTWSEVTSDSLHPPPNVSPSITIDHCDNKYLLICSVLNELVHLRELIVSTLLTDIATF